MKRTTTPPLRDEDMQPNKKTKTMEQQYVFLEQGEYTGTNQQYKTEQQEQAKKVLEQAFEYY
jgi:hypothetical protein